MASFGKSRFKSLVTCIKMQDSPVVLLAGEFAVKLMWILWRP